MYHHVLPVCTPTVPRPSGTAAGDPSIRRPGSISKGVPALQRYILGIDQGTTATKSVLVDPQQALLARSERALEQVYPHPGWVEMRAEDIWQSILTTAQEAMSGKQIEAVGLANQGESVIAWDALTGEPLYNVITWQCARTAARCTQIEPSVDVDRLLAGTGLLLDPYFSATKMQWLLENVPAVHDALQRGTLRMGTLDSWMMWRMSGGRLFVTDYTTAARTMLFGIQTLDWEDALLAFFGVPRWVLPDPRPSASLLGETDPGSFLGLRVPIAGSAVDQPASLFAHGCFGSGDLKITYGTGAFMIMNIGRAFRRSDHGLLTSLAASATGDPVQYYLDGGVYSVGAAVRWLQKGLGLFAGAAQTEEMAASLASSEGVVFVPALVGLAAPHWTRQVKAAFLGMTAATTREHLVRAVLESVAFRVLEVVRAMEEDAGARIEAIRVDGGVAQNDFLMQFQADLLGVPLHRAHTPDMTALGAALLAGLAVGTWCMDDLGQARETDVFLPQQRTPDPLAAFELWQEAVRLAEGFG